MKDTLYSTEQSRLKPFDFNQDVAEVFDDMIKRSVPGYEIIIQQIATLSRQVAKPNTKIYDLGSSLGAAVLAVRRSLEDPSIEIIAVDKSKAMIDKSRQLLGAYHSEMPVQLLEDDILNIEINNASLVIMNFTLQFLPLEQRDLLIKRIYQGLNSGGVLVLSEKITFTDNDIDRLITALHQDFKRSQGYSELEISQKRDSLQDVLITETLSEHKSRLNQSGFSSSEVWCQQYNFASMVAIK